MKKLIVIISLVYSGGIYAQQFGMKGGLNISNLGGDSQGVSSKTSFHVGLFVLAPLSEKVKIMPELVYSSQGASVNSSSLRVNYNYLNIPVMFNFYPTEKFFLQAGPQLGILTSAELTDGTNSQNIKSQLKETDFSLGLGLGADLPKVILNARYNLGLSSTSKATSGSFPNGVFQISVGFKF
jgi:hypothetical protein